ncbi:MAG: Nucleolar protein 16 [Candelina submexicana]|nr:MAG: Nucleolar protein 16 [Candelina submexicana]
MGRELQKKKNRSSISKVKHKPKSKKHPILGNPIVAANWDQSLTLSQNYHRLGLTRKLNAPTGGTERKPIPSTAPQKDALNITNKVSQALIPTEAHIDRDPDTGAILRVLHPASSSSNPLNDPLNNIIIPPPSQDANPAQRPSTNIVAQLEQQASMAKKKQPRKQSEREREWIERLVGRWGTDVVGMRRDMELNPMQQSEGDLRRRIERWRER